MNRKSALFLTAAALFLTAFQPFFNKLGGVYAMCPDMIAAFCAAIAPAAGYYSLIFAGACGMLLDLQLGTAYFGHMFLYLLTALLAVRLVKRQVNVFASAACCGAASVAFSRLWGIAAAFVRGYSVDFYAGVLKMLPAVCLTAIAAAFLTLVGSAILKSAPFRTREGGVKYR